MGDFPYVFQNILESFIIAPEFVAALVSWHVHVFSLFYIYV
jgi:hypothetical protein